MTIKTKKLVPWEGVITNIQSNVLQELAQYKYLTLSQMLTLQVGTKHYQYLWKQVMSIRDRKRPLVGCHRFKSPNPRAGRVESMYYLTKRGKQVLIDDLLFPPEKIKFQSGKTVAYKDYQHRVSTIDFHIALSRWAKEQNYELVFFDYYFDKVGNNRTKKNLRAKTKIAFEGEDYFIPDGAGKFITPSSEKFILFEMYNGKDTKRVLQQIGKHAVALVYRYTHKAYKLDENKSYNILMLFEHESSIKALIKRVKQHVQQLKNIQHYFLSKSVEELESNHFATNWTTLFGEKKSLF